MSDHPARATRIERLIAKRGPRSAQRSPAREFILSNADTIFARQPGEAASSLSASSYALAAPTAGEPGGDGGGALGALGAGGGGSSTDDADGATPTSAGAPPSALLSLSPQSWAALLRSDKLGVSEARIFEVQSLYHKCRQEVMRTRAGAARLSSSYRAPSARPLVGRRAIRRFHARLARARASACQSWHRVGRVEPPRRARRPSGRSLKRSSGAARATDDASTNAPTRPTRRSISRSISVLRAIARAQVLRQWAEATAASERATASVAAEGAGGGDAASVLRRCQLVDLVRYPQMSAPELQSVVMPSGIVPLELVTEALFHQVWIRCWVVWSRSSNQRPRGRVPSSGSSAQTWGSIEQTWRVVLLRRRPVSKQPTRRGSFEQGAWGDIFRFQTKPGRDEKMGGKLNRRALRRRV